MSYPIEKLFNQPLELTAPVEQLWDEASGMGNPRYLLHDSITILRTDEYDLSSPLKAPECIELAEAHYAKLAEFGMFVLSHANVIATDESSDTVSLFQATPEILVRDMHIVDPIRPTLTAIIGPKLHTEAVIPLNKYISWCTASRSSHMLVKIFEPDTLRYHYETQHVYLHDVEPALQAANGRNRRVARQAVETMRSFT